MNSTIPRATVFGLALPASARLHIGVQGLDSEQYDGLITEATEAGIPVHLDQSGGTRWAELGGLNSSRMTLFAPDGHDHRRAFDEAIDRKLAGVKFIEISADEDATVEGQR